MAVTDVEIAERVEAGVIVRQDNQQDAKQGIRGAMRQTSTKVSNMNKYRTVSLALPTRQILQYEEAATDLTNGFDTLHFRSVLNIPRSGSRGSNCSFGPAFLLLDESGCFRQEAPGFIRFMP